MVQIYNLRCYCWKGFNCPVESCYHQNHKSISEQFLNKLNVVTSHHASHTIVAEFPEENFRDDSTAFSEKQLTIWVLRIVIKISITVSYLSSISPRINCSRCLSAYLSIDKLIVTTSFNLGTHYGRRKYLPSDLNFMCLTKKSIPLTVQPMEGAVVRKTTLSFFHMNRFRVRISGEVISL